MRKVAWTVIGLAWLACKQEGRPSPDESERARSAPAAAPPAVEDERPYEVTSAKLAAFVTYQRRMLEVQGALLKDLETLSERLDAGQLQVSRSLKAIDEKARSEEKARKALGLSLEDVNRLSRIVTDVMAQRHLARLMKFDEELATLEKAREKLPADQRAGLEAQMASLKAQAATFDDLADAKREHGAANVELVLTREDELIRNYRQMLEAY